MKPTEAPTTAKPTEKPTVAPTTAKPTEPVVTRVLVGDVNFDGVINVVDATAIQRIAAEQVVPTEAAKIAGDVDGNGIVTVVDATLVQRYAAGLSNTGNAGKYVDGPVPPVPPTEAPTTVIPTEKPTVAPTTQAPTQAPTQKPTEAPTTQAPTQAPTEKPTDPPTPSKAVYLNASATCSGTEDWYAWTWTTGEGQWIKGEGDASRVTFSGEIGTSILFVRLPKGETPCWDPKNIWNKTDDLTVQMGGTFVTSGWNNDLMLGSWS